MRAAAVLLATVAAYEGASTTRTVWRYRLDRAALHFVSGERSVEYPAATCPRRVKPRAVARAFDTTVGRLVHPQLEGVARIAGRIRVDDTVGPYEPQNDDGVRNWPPSPSRA